MLINWCFRTDSQLLQHRVCQHLYDKWTASCLSGGFVCRDWQLDCDCNTDLYSRLWLSTSLMTSTDSSSREHVHQFTATLNRPLVCLKILTRVWIREKKVQPSTKHCVLIKLIWSTHRRTAGFNHPCGTRLTSVWIRCTTFLWVVCRWLAKL